jgi:hypothetical protein
MSIISGTALGVFCEHFAEKSRWYHSKTTTKNAGGCEASDGCEAAPATTAAADDNDRAAGGSFAAGGKKAIRGRKLNTDNIPPAVLFFAGLFMAAAMLFTKGVLIRLTLFFIFFLAALAVGKAGNLLFTFMFFFVIVFFNTLIPYGKVLCKIGTFSLTEGGLTQGIEKAAAVEGLVMLSRVTISPRLHLPGKAGALLSEAFLLLPRLYEKKTKIHAKTFISDIDKVLLELDSK